MSFKRGKRWYAEYLDENGARKRESTKARTRQECDIIEAELALRAERVRKGLEVNDRNPDKLTVRAAVDWWADNIAAKQVEGGGAATLKKHILIGGDDAIVDLPLERVNRGVVDKWLDAIEAAGEHAPATVNHARAYLSSTFTHLIRLNRFFGPHPVRSSTKREVEPAEPRALPAHTIRPLIEEAPTPGWRVVIALAVWAGLRRKEIRTLKWSRIDFDEGVIHIVKTKKKRPRRVPIHPELRPILDEAATRRGTADAVITRAAWTKSAIITQRALKRAGVHIPAGVDACFHSLRHTWATHAVACGARMDIIELIGWGPRAGSVMALTYLHLPVSTLAAELAKLSWPSPARVLTLKRGNAK